MYPPTLSKWSESASTAGSRIAVFVERYVGSVLRVIGKGIGIAAGAVMAVWDFHRGIQEIGEGNDAVGWLYIGSAGLAGVAIFAFSGWGAVLLGGAAATGVGVVLVVLVVVIAVFIEIFKDNKLQDWMERCYFGKFASKDRYSDPEQELKELDIALEG